jgi:DNA-directed RNA polymerase sigma subunit (sigma70/sigma32)
MHKQRIKDNPHQVARGEQQSSSKLTDQKVKEIIEHLNEKTYKIIELAMMYDVDRRTIDSIKRGTSWTHIERESIASYNIGSNHHSSKLTENDVLEIKKKLKEGNYSTLTSLAKEFGITVQSLHKIKTGKSWSHIAI